MLVMRTMAFPRPVRRLAIRLERQLSTSMLEREENYRSTTISSLTTTRTWMVVTRTSVSAPTTHICTHVLTHVSGSGGIALLDGAVFKGGDVQRLAIAAGKNGKVYVLNADNLGGYKQGTGGTDLIVQTIVTNKAVFGGPGSYPLEGGYIYYTPVGYPVGSPMASQ